MLKTMKAKGDLRTRWLLAGILLLGLFLRIYKPAQLFLFSHDQDLAGWIIKDIVVNGHPRLIGQLTSTQGIFIGPLFYYFLIPFYLAFNMNPIGGVVLITLLGIFSIFSFYWVFSKVFNDRTGLIAAFLYAISFYTVFNDREVVPTMPVIVWSVWYFYTINLLLKGKQKLAYPILGILLGLIWHLNVGLVLLVPLIPVAQWLSRKRLKKRPLVLGLIVLFITSLPLLLFELRHNFSQTKALHRAFTTNQYAIVSGADKLGRTVHLAAKNVAGFLWGPLPGVSHEVALYFLLAIFIFLVWKKVVRRAWIIIFSLWVLIYVLFFSFYSKVLSEYYLNGMMVVWIAALALGVSYLMGRRRLKKWSKYALFAFAAINLYRFFTLDINRSGYLERRAIVAEIKRDAQLRGFPCVAASYITDPGYDLGYRYFFWLEGLHVNRPQSGSPVYTIVFPLKPIFGTDKTFGAIGLIYPDYPRYTREKVKTSCGGENSNLTDPMFGYTE